MFLSTCLILKEVLLYNRTDSGEKLYLFLDYKITDDLRMGATVVTHGGIEEEDAAGFQEKKWEDRLLESCNTPGGGCRTAKETPLDLVNELRKPCTGARRTETAVESGHKCRYVL